MTKLSVWAQKHPVLLWLILHGILAAVYFGAVVPASGGPKPGLWLLILASMGVSLQTAVGKEWASRLTWISALIAPFFFACFAAFADRAASSGDLALLGLMMWALLTMNGIYKAFECRSTPEGRRIAKAALWAIAAPVPILLLGRFIAPR